MQSQSTAVAASLRALMTHVIDYAGLFPPAALSLPEAFQNYVRCCQEPDRWMLSRFIINTTQLTALSQLIDQQASLTAPVDFSVLGRSGRTSAEFLDNLRDDLALIKMFHARYSSQITTSVFEVRLPLAMVSEKTSAAQIDDLLQNAADLLAEIGINKAFYEVPFVDGWGFTVHTAISAIASYNLTHSAPIGFKLRCGGVEASAFPTSAQLARAIGTCRDQKVAFKATSGLHHPICHDDVSVHTKMHGFLNVVGASILAHIYNLDQAAITAILEDENASHFTFSDDTFTWQTFGTTTNEINAVRQHGMISFGSCSFDDPRADLQALGLFSNQ